MRKGRGREGRREGGGGREGWREGGREGGRKSRGKVNKKKKKEVDGKSVASLSFGRHILSAWSINYLV